MDYRVVGTFSECCQTCRMYPNLSLNDVEILLQGRTFSRWYKRNEKAIRRLSVITPAVAFVLFGISATIYPYLFLPVAVPVSAPGAFGFFNGHGSILLHILIVGFLTLIITTFLKFTGRGDLAPLVVFIAGGVILYEVIGLFNDIYKSIANFLS